MDSTEVRIETASPILSDSSAMTVESMVTIANDEKSESPTLNGSTHLYSAPITDAKLAQNKIKVSTDGMNDKIEIQMPIKVMGKNDENANSLAAAAAAVVTSPISPSSTLTLLSAIDGGAGGSGSGGVGVDGSGGGGNGSYHRIPLTVWLGIVQLMFSILLVALGCLVIARSASLCSMGAGVWAGAIAGVTGALGVMNVRRALTGFVAASLICVASSTLALALTGIGAVRDSNLAKQDEAIWGAVAGDSALLFALGIHFLVSVFSVYYAAMRLCARPSMHYGPAIQRNSTVLTQQKVEEYIKSMHHGDYQTHQKMMSKGGFKEQHFGTANSQEGLIAMWLGGAGGKRHMKQQQQQLHQIQQISHGPRSVMLVPAGQHVSMPAAMYPPMLYPPHLMSAGGPPPPMPYLMPHPSDVQAKLNRKKSARSARAACRAKDARARRKSEADAQKFTYTGLDRAIADNFLERQAEQANHRAGDSDSIARCRDVAM